MIIDEKRGDILASGEPHIAFAVNKEGINGNGFAGMVAFWFWPELANTGPLELGTVLTKTVDGVHFYALCCHSLDDGWPDQRDTIKKCFDAIETNEPIASVAIGTGRVGQKQGADFEQIKAGMQDSVKRIVIYYAE